KRLAPAGPRRKGWQATPLADGADQQPFGVRLVRGPEALPRSGRQHASIGYALADGRGAKIGAGARALLAQEVRSPRAGRYTLTIHASGGAGSPAEYRDIFLQHFACRMVVYGYTDLRKDPA